MTLVQKGVQTSTAESNHKPEHSDRALSELYGMKVRTTNIFPPIPLRQFDWQAVFDDDEPNDNGSMMVGYGSTEAEALEDLKNEFEASERFAAEDAAAEAHANSQFGVGA